MIEFNGSSIKSWSLIDKWWKISLRKFELQIEFVTVCYIWLCYNLISLSISLLGATKCDIIELRDLLGIFWLYLDPVCKPNKIPVG